MADLPVSPEDPLVPVVELAKIAGCSASYFYRLARRGQAPKHEPWKGVPLSAAIAWLKERDAKKTAKAETVQRLRSLYEATATKGSGT
jgi:predicted DNA-binding transcriptional regulator AlpA